jgi:hypothetical protein
VVEASGRGEDDGFSCTSTKMRSIRGTSTGWWNLQGSRMIHLTTYLMIVHTIVTTSLQIVL